jgi:hypothetical protein
MHHRDTEDTAPVPPAAHFSREAAKVAKESIANINLRVFAASRE